MDIKNGQLVTTGNTVITPLVVIDDSQYDTPFATTRLTNYSILVVAGTVKFGVGGIGANAYAVPAGAGRFQIRCKNGQLYCQQAAGGDTFMVTTF